MGLEVFNYECQDQMSIFDLTMPEIQIDKPIRLIETFSGYGSQSMTLDEMGAEYEHYKISEWEVNANKSYKACHIKDNTDYSEIYSKEEIINKLLTLGISNDGKKPMTEKEIRRKSEKWQRKTYNEFTQCHNLGSITNVHGKDLKIVDTDTYFYFLTYSFPCTDISVAGKMKGMKKGSGTRSGLLWEVERILTEIHESGGELPQLLFMENVPQVISSANINDFHAWQDFLTSLGYTSHVQTLNAKDYGVAQNRERTFMFSFLGEYNYHFPKPIPLTKTMKDYLEDEVEEKYYINTEKADKLLKELVNNEYLNPKANYIPSLNKTSYPLTSQDFVRTGFSDISYTLSARDYKDPKNVVGGNINPSGNGMNGNVYSGDLAPTLTTNKGEGQKIVEVNQVGNIAEENNFSNPQAGRVYATDGCAPTLNTCSGGGHEPKIVAMRGRNPQNPSDITIGAQTEQRLEPNSQDLCNTITSVQKDNLVLESAILTPKRTEYGKEIRKSYESGIVKESRHNMTQLEPRNDGISNTLTTVQKDNMVLETVCIKQATKDGYIDCKIGGVADLSFPTSETRRGRVQDNGDTYPTITAGETEICRIESRYRIRKLTPRECGRLMFVSDTNITKMLAVVSNSQAYKQFGNSIVVLCMIAMFSNLNIQNLPRWDEIKDRYM